MKRRLVTGVAVVVALLALAGVAFALWAMSARVYTSVEIGAKPAIGLVAGAFTNDDGVGNNADIDPADNGLDPSSHGPKPTRYGQDIGHCTATSDGSPDGTLAVSAAYGGYYCEGSFVLSSSQTTTVQAVRWGTTALTDCPTVTQIDTDEDLSPDLGLCVAAMDGTSAVPLLGHALSAGTPVMAFVEVAVLDTATPSQAVEDTITFEGGSQQ